MVRLASTPILLLAAAISTNGFPTLNKRIAQTIADATAKWEKACDAAKGGEQCNPLSVSSMSTLLAAAAPCDQQDAADKMVDLAKTLKQDESSDMIKLAQIFAQQPRNSPDSLTVAYCDKAPKNQELTGVFQCQFQGVNTEKFTNNLQAGDPGTVPFGLKKLDPAGSCPAHTSGFVDAGAQLVDSTQDPGTVGSKASGGAGNSGNDAGNGGNGTDTGSAGGDSGDNGTATSTGSVHIVTITVTRSHAATGTATATGSADIPAPTSTGTPADGDNGDGEDDGEDCPADGSNDEPADPSSSADPSPAASSATPASTGSAGPASAVNAQCEQDCQTKNGQAAQALNKKFASLTADSACDKEGETACIDGKSAECANGKFVVTPCSGGLTCFALPLVAKSGTSAVCDTKDDALARIAATGVTGGLDGSS